MSWYTIRDIYKAVYLPLSRVNIILKRILKYKRFLPFMSNTYLFFDIVNIALWTVLIQYRQNIVQYWTFMDFTFLILPIYLWFHIFDIVDFAVSTMLKRYRVYIANMFWRSYHRHRNVDYVKPIWNFHRRHFQHLCDVNIATLSTLQCIQCWINIEITLFTPHIFTNIYIIDDKKGTN